MKKSLVVLLVELSVFATEITMFYPVAMGVPLTKLMDKLVSDFEAENPDITVEVIYPGNYYDTMTKAMTALKGGNHLTLAVVLLSIELYTLIDKDAIVLFDDLISTPQEKNGLIVLSGSDVKQPYHKRKL